jgi:tripartite ATP-independent transporter DctM subunit
MDDVAIYSLAVSLGIMAVLFMAGVQIGVVLAVAGIIGSALFTGNVSIGASLLSLQSLDVTSNYSLLVIPLFIALGSLAAASGITTDLFSAYYKWFGRIAGGIAIATIVTCASMAAITGSSVAVAAAMCRIALPELRRYNYSLALSVGAICVGGTVAIMIPPSITLVLFAIFAEESVGKLLIAGVMPGLLTAFLYCVLILVICWIRPSLGPPGPAFSRAEKIASIKLVLPFAIVVLSVVLGMLSGIWTPVEAAAIGVMLVLGIGFLRRTQSLRDVAVAFRDSAMTSASVMIVVIGSLVYSNFLALNGFSEVVTEGIVGLRLPPFLLYLMLISIYLVLGCLMEVTSILALTVPLIIPVVKAVGWSPIWFGVVVVSMMEVAAVTPPVGLNLYAVKAAASDVPIGVIAAGSFPFWCMNIAVVFILYFFPDIALWLPGRM